MLVPCLVLVLDGGLLVLSFVKLVMDFDFMAMMRLCFLICVRLRLETCLSVSDFKLSVPVLSIFVFDCCCNCRRCRCCFVVVHLDSGILIFVGDEARCLSSRFWFAMLENSLGLLAGFVLFSLEVNACHGVDYRGVL